MHVNAAAAAIAANATDLDMTPSSVHPPVSVRRMTEQVERFPEGEAVKTLKAWKRFGENWIWEFLVFLPVPAHHGVRDAIS